MADLHTRLRDDLRTAMKARDALRRDTLRLVQAAIKNAEIEKRAPLDEPAIAAVLQKQVKQRQESIVQFEQGGRQDLVDKEQAEMAILETYLPEQLSRDDILAQAQAAIGQVGAAGPHDKGKVMGPLMAELRGKADGHLVNEIVDELLSAE
jgi:uncharacterized protein YqeY